MKIKKIITFCVILGLPLMISNNALGYMNPPATYTWNTGTPGYEAGATLHSGTINTSLLVAGDYLGRSAAQLTALSYGRSDAAVGWDDTWTGGGNDNTNGDALDGMWVQVYDTGGWWDMGKSVSTIAVFTSQDHGPYLGEGLEYYVYASNTLWDASPTLIGPGASGSGLTDVYLDGWRTHNTAEDSNGNGWLSDDISGVFNLGGSYQYIWLKAWGASPYNEPEIDAVCEVVPVPGAVLLGIIGLSVAGVKLRKHA